MKVLIATDGSDTAADAIKRLGDFISPATTEAILLSVYPNPLAGTSGLERTYLDATEVEVQLRREAERMVAEGQAILESRGFKGVRSRVVEGDAASVILDVSAEEQVDLVVVGSHGRTGLSRFLMGSVSSRVVDHAACSVLVIRHSPR